MSDAAQAIKTNPANPQPVVESREKPRRIPMSVPSLKLAVPEIPGYHQHWFVTEEVAQALRAGYTFVEPEDTDTSLAEFAGGENQDMGTRVSSLASREIDPNTGQAPRLYLMKLPMTDWLEDQKALEGRSEQMLDSLRVGLPAEGGDNSHRYSPTPEANRNIFRPRKIRS
jgi:hypothetical protein